MAKGLRMTRSRIKALIKKTAKSRGARAATPLPPKGPNATERMFNLRFLEGKGKFEAETLVITSLGKKYTPDFSICIDVDGLTYMVYVEVKGEYRSKKDEKLITERSRLAWEVAADQFKDKGYFPDEDIQIDVVFVWAKKNGIGFDIEVVFTPYRTRAEGFCKNGEDLEGLIKNVVNKI